MNKEYTKEKLTSIRLYVTIVATLNSACIAWFVANIKSIDVLLRTYNILAIVLLTSTFALLTIKLVRDSRQLKGANNE